MKVVMAVLLALVLCAAKSEFGADFDPTALTRLEPGVTRYEQVITELGGPPQQTVTLPQGIIRTWSYAQGKASMWTGKISTTARSATLQFSLDGNFQRVLGIQGFELPPDQVARLMQPPPPASHSP